MQQNIHEELSFKIIEKELELEHNCSMGIVNDLVNMYRQVIEAYESVQNSKFYDFQDRLHKILMRSDVLAMLRQDSELEKQNYRKSKEVELKRTNFRSRKTSSMEINTEKITRKLSRIMENRESMDKSSYNKAVNDIQSQNTNLDERLERRRRQSSIQNIKTFKKPLESDSGAGSLKTDKQKILEDLLEKSFTEKAEGIVRIKAKYDAEIKLGKKDSINLLEMRDQEIKKESDKYDQKRKSEILKFKQMYN
jgi:hypothetical protein